MTWLYNYTPQKWGITDVLAYTVVIIPSPDCQAAGVATASEKSATRRPCCYTAEMQFSLRLLLLGVVPGVALVFTVWALMGQIEVRYAHRDLFFLFRFLLTLFVALACAWTIREAGKWSRGDAATQRAYLKWTRRRQ